MPDPHERHARPGKHAYYGEPPRGSRGQNRREAAAFDGGADPMAGSPVTRRPPGKKDPDLCKGQHWKGPHTPVPRLRIIAGRKACGWTVSYTRQEPMWYCLHVLVCSGCGKDFGRVYGEDCPSYRGITPHEQAWVGEQIKLHAERMARWRRPRKVINGPQGYRKKKKGPRDG